MMKELFVDKYMGLNDRKYFCVIYSILMVFALFFTPVKLLANEKWYNYAKNSLPTQSCEKQECVQIIFTTDLHSQTNYYKRYKNVGTFAGLKYFADMFKKAATHHDIQSLRLDSGDISEGGLFFVGEEGAASYRLGNLLELDAMTVGNHEVLPGLKYWDEILGKAQITFPMLAANISNIPAEYQHLEKAISPYRIFPLLKKGQKTGRNVCVIGATLQDYKYKWAIGEMVIDDPVKSIIKTVKDLRKLKVDCAAVVALTHIGFKWDVLLAKKAYEYVDLIIGGDSHNFLHELHEYKAPNGKVVPIAQAGAHGKFLGQVVLQLNPKTSGIKVLKHKLHLNAADIPEDKALKDYLQKVYEDIEQNVYPHVDLGHEVGHSEVGLSHGLSMGGYPLNDHGGEGSEKSYGHFIADAFRIETYANVAIHPYLLSGMDIPKGPVTLRDIVESYPRVSFMDTAGWEIYYLDLFGIVMEKLMDIIVNNGFGVYLSGISVDIKTLPSGKKSVTIKSINGRPYEGHNALTKYRVAFPQGVFEGSQYHHDPLAREFIGGAVRTKVKIWDALAYHFERVRTITPDYTKGNLIDRSFTRHIRQKDLE